MAGALRRRVVAGLPEPALRRLQRLRHGESPALGRPIRIGASKGVTPAVVTEFDAHAVRGAVARTIGAALDTAGVGYALLPGPRGTVAQVAVDATDRAAALAAIQGVAAGPGWVVEAAGPDRLRAYRVLASPDGHPLCGQDTATELAFWTRVTRPDVPRADGGTHPVGTRLAPPDNPVLGALSASDWDAAVAAPTHWPRARPLPYALDVREPVDIVYTWVDGADPAWQQRKAEHQPAADEHNPVSVAAARFTNRDELRYSLRSVAMYAGWVRRIHLVTDGQVPEWLGPSDERIRVVDHRDIFSDPSVLPVFNSHAIESQLHHVPDLTEHYLYFNDDVFLGRPVEPELFFHGNGIAKFFLSKQTLDLDAPSARDLAPMSAAKHNRELIERDFGVTIRHKMRHGVNPQRRSVLVEMEQRYPDLFTRVSASRYRHPDDHSIVSSLQQYYAYATARAVPAELQYRYQDISRADTPRRLDEILRQRPQVFCLNDIDSAAHQLDAQHVALREFFSVYFPLPAPWERPGRS